MKWMLYTKIKILNYTCFRSLLNILIVIKIKINIATDTENLKNKT